MYFVLFDVVKIEIMLYFKAKIYAIIAIAHVAISTVIKEHVFTLLNKFLKFFILKTAAA